MIRSQRLLLKPTFKQARMMRGACGLSRFAWNWAVAICRRHYRMFGKTHGFRRPSAFTLQKHWNKIKNRRTKLSWVADYSKLIPEMAFNEFGNAMKMAFKRLKAGKKPGFPRFHKKGRKESFNSIPSSHHPLFIQDGTISIRRVGRVRIQTPLRWPGAKQVYGQVKFKAGRWWLTISYDLPDPAPLPMNRPSCGIDLGCKTFATVASGGEIVEELEPPKPYAKAKRRLKRVNRIASRRFVKGKRHSRRFLKAKLKLAKAHERVADVRDNFLHNLTARLVKRFGTITIEDLSVKGMMAGFLSGTIADLGFGEFRRQLTYKAEAVGTKIVVANRFYPSSKTCHGCGHVHKNMILGVERMECHCGWVAHRDHNAALNLGKLPVSDGKDTHAESGGSPSSRKVKRGAARRSVNANRPTETLV